jgi:DNA replication factor GINS
MATDEEGMTTEERDLFTDLVARIRQNRETVLATLGGTADTGAAGDTTVADVAPTEPTADGEPSTPAERVDPTDPAPAGEGAEAATDLLADALGGGTVGDGETRGVADSPSDTDDGRADADRPVGEATAVSDGSDETSGTSEASEVEPPGTGPPATATATSTATDDDGSTPDVGSGPERTTLRITADVGTVYGVDDREYDLAREDVVTLPTTNAEPLLRKDAAERID